MTLLSRMSIAGSQSRNVVRVHISSFNLVRNSQFTLRRYASTEATSGAQKASSSTSKNRLNKVGNVLLATGLVGATASTIFFTYLRVRQNQFGVSANTIMEEGLHPAHYPWPNDHPLATFDHARYIITIEC